MIDLQKRECEIIKGLKDFQRATVERVYYLFNEGYTRVLVGDEVGLGKTHIAKGTVAKMARYYKEVLNKDLFKVIYICSNQSIASQNINKLRIDNKVSQEGVWDTRLSMQHLKIYESDNDEQVKENYIQLIPLTPSTSFNIINGCGSVSERALTYAILKRYEPLNKLKVGLEILLRDRAQSAWTYWAKEHFEERVYECNNKSNNKYIEDVLEKVDKYFQHNLELLEELTKLCYKIQNYPNLKHDGTTKMIQHLRTMMAFISVDLMNPDLVIMDEFQRFNEIIDIKGESETAILARRFFNNNNDIKTKVLLLSATPYKLYSTLEEINESGEDEHYKEFMKVMDFVFYDNEDLRESFKQVWKDYSTTLHEATKENFATLVLKKNIAEDYLYKGICRTERILIKESNDIIDLDISKHKASISEYDIISYTQMDNIVKNIDLKYNVPVEYIKSAPYIMSFMNTYKLKEKIFTYFKNNPKEVSIVKGDKIWVNAKKINKYDEIHMGNGRLEKIREISIPKNAERLLWIPPSRPYYSLGGAFKGNEHFSKILIFSAWEMVPRAIATLISYEAERLTVGKLVKITPNENRERRGYFNTKNRFPAPRIKYNIGNSLSLLYPSITLSKLFNPVDVINRNLTLKDIKNELENNISILLEKVSSEININNRIVDRSWYYIAPLLFDLEEESVGEFLNNINLIERREDENNDVDKSSLAKNFEELKEIYFNKDNITLGKMPNDLKAVLVNMTLGSPSIAALRLLKDNNRDSLINSVRIGKTILDRFNTQEATSIVELQYGKRSDDTHWKNVLKYCVDGNIQAMLDEYTHMLEEANDMNSKSLEDKNNILTDIMCKNLKSHSASYNIDTYESFVNRVNGDISDKSKKMRSGYAAGFYDTKKEDGKVQRKDSLRHSFNSPFRPFVLASTSIGQEGLDFHYYCRKIVHWNLPSNPIDLEQREGRINRYKSLAIRQNIVQKYGNIKFKNNIWNEMFKEASINNREDNTCELVPFWCLPGVCGPKIERIVPYYPFSKDIIKYERLIKILSLYRLSLGQARQQELIEYLFSNDIKKDELDDLFMNLSPIYK